MNGIRILVADSYELVLHGIARVISQAHPDWEIVALATSGDEAIQQARLHQPTVAVLDLAMPDRSGIEVAECITSELQSVRILILASQISDSLVRRLQKSGVHGCVAKHEVIAHLVEALEQVVAGRTALFCRDRESKPDTGAHAETVPARFLLTARELTVMRMLAEGRTNKIVASELALSVRTVESHRASILNKLGISSIGDLVRLAIRDSLI